MRTSATQFDLMVTFMEQHGDLNKFSTSANGRLANIHSWAELAQLLNSDGSGDTKTVEKWKKVWGDYKNNIKKKAARIHRAATGTGGGPASCSRLTDIEQRVLNLVGAQAATGLAVEEAGLPQVMPNADRDAPTSHPHIFIELPPIEEPGQSNINSLPQVGPISSPPTQNFTEEEVQNSQPWNVPGTSAQSPFNERSQVENAGVVTPTNIGQPEPSRSGQTTPRRTMRPHNSPRRRLRPTQVDQAAQHFLKSDEDWRKFKMQQHRDIINKKKEQMRIRQRELEIQANWQLMGHRVIDLLEKLVNHHCKD